MARDNHIAVVADENALCSAGLLHMMEHCLSFSKVLTCRNFAELTGILGQHRSRVALAAINYDLPGMKRTNGLHRLCEAWPSVRILVIADCCDRDTMLEVLSAGSHGFISRNSSPFELERALTATARGQDFVTSMSADGSARESPQAKFFTGGKLTPRQKEVLDLLAAGKSNKQIAWVLGISEGTVKVHVNAAFRVLGVHNRVNATTALLASCEFAEAG